MGNKSSKTPKNKPLEFYQEFIDKQSKEMYGEYEEISHKIQKSKRKIQPFPYKEKCLSCCFDSTSLNEHRRWRDILKFEANKIKSYSWNFLYKICKIPLENDFKFIAEIKSLDFKYGFFQKRDKISTQIQEYDFINSFIDSFPNNTRNTSPQSSSYRYIFNKEIDDFQSKKSMDMSGSLKSYSFQFRKILRNQKNLEKRKNINLKIKNDKNIILQELHFKELFKILQIHFTNPSHPIFLAKTLYREYFLQKYQKKIEEIFTYNENDEQIQKILSLLVRDFKAFVNIFSETIIHFYNLIKYNVLFKDSCLITRDMIYNLTLNGLYFEEIFEFLEKIHKKILSKDLAILKEKFDRMGQRNPENFGISPKFCLNEKSFEKFHQKPIQDDYIFIPYIKTVECLKEIMLLKSPTQKLEQIFKTVDMLFQEIKEFYEGFNEIMEEEISGDDMLSLFIFIIVKSNIPELLIHCKILDLFMTNNQINSITGYYVSTIQVALTYICKQELF